MYMSVVLANLMYMRLQTARVQSNYTKIVRKRDREAKAVLERANGWCE